MNNFFEKEQINNKNDNLNDINNNNINNNKIDYRKCFFEAIKTGKINDLKKIIREIDIDNNNKNNKPWEFLEDEDYSGKININNLNINI
jgi:hypothetical protein